MAKTKALISFAITARVKLICAFVFAQAFGSLMQWLINPLSVSYCFCHQFFTSMFSAGALENHEVNHVSSFRTKVTQKKGLKGTFQEFILFVDLKYQCDL